MKKLVIFGSGKIGHDALIFLGSENIECFCDNNLSLKGTERYGKKIRSFEELRTNSKDVIVVIADLCLMTLPNNVKRTACQTI